MELGGRQHSLAALLLEKRRKLRNNEKSSTKIIAHIKSRKKHKKMDKWRARRAFKSSQRRNGLLGPNFRAGRRRAHTHTHTHTFTINVDQIHILIN